jgi:predicted Fe-Mo cluster-binding NifX family protein
MKMIFNRKEWKNISKGNHVGLQGGIYKPRTQFSGKNPRLLRAAVKKIKSKLRCKMKIGITMDTDEGMKGTVSQHLGQCTHFLVVGIENGKVISEDVYKNEDTHGGGGCAAVAGISKYGISHVISGGMGAGAKAKFAAAGITVFGFSGSVKDAVAGFIKNSLGNIEACAGHGHGHEDGGRCHGHN